MIQMATGIKATIAAITPIELKVSASILATAPTANPAIISSNPAYAIKAITHNKRFKLLNLVKSLITSIYSVGILYARIKIGSITV